jgi:hypothetical protein
MSLDITLQPLFDAINANLPWVLQLLGSVAGIGIAFLLGQALIRIFAKQFASLGGGGK